VPADPSKVSYCFKPFVIAAVLVCFLSVGSGADVLTPSGNAPANQEDQALLEGVARIDLSEITGEILSTVHVSLNKFDQVLLGIDSWHGPQDASLSCDVSFTPTALYIEGDLTDDVPFCQRMIHPAKPEWWKIEYGADGIVFDFQDITSASQRVSFALNWSSRAVYPKVDILRSLVGARSGFSAGACLELSENREQAKGSTCVHFRVGVPITDLAEPSFFNRPLLLQVSLIDLDGDYPSITVLRESVKVPGSGASP